MNGQKLKELRRQLGISQSHLGKTLGVAANTVSQWELGKSLIPKDIAQRVQSLARRKAAPGESSVAQAIIRDPHHQSIVEALNRRLDPDVFEGCAADLLKQEWPTLVPVRGGSDDGFDGAVVQGVNKPIPLITTVAGDLRANLRRNLHRAMHKGAAKKAIFATSRPVTPKMRQALKEVAKQLGASLIHVYEQDWFANALYRDPSWCKRLLNVTGRPSALSIHPITSRPLLGQPILGRDHVLQRIRDTKVDCVLIGEPGSGKTALLRLLAQEGRALFMTDPSPEELANAIREQRPQAIIADDAHVNPSELMRLGRLRREIGADFRIIAVSWSADKDDVVSAINVAKSDVFELDQLDADTMAEIVKSVGVRGPNHLIHSIVQQAEGRPGLAVTLADLCLRGDGQNVFAGDALASQLSPILNRLLGADASRMLGAFGLGGSSGVEQEVIASFLGIPDLQVSTSLARLATAGVVREVHARRISVWPEQLRWVLVRDTFFKGPGALSYEKLMNLVPDKKSALDALIGARSRGADIPGIERIIEEQGSVRLWCYFASIGDIETKFVLRHHPELALEIAELALLHAPDEVIPMLLDRAIGDDRPLHSYIDHPLRKISDWVLDALPGTGEGVGRRRILVGAVRFWFARNDKLPGSGNVAIRAMSLALSPGFEARETDPGRGLSMKITWGILQDEELGEVAKEWPSLLKIVQVAKDFSWESILNVLGDWLYPGARYRSAVRARSQKALKAHAGEMIESISAVSQGHPGLQRRLIELSRRAGVDLKLSRDLEFEVLYPRRDPRDRIERSSGWLRAVEEIAARWAGELVEDVASRMAWYEIESSRAGITYPRLMPALAGMLVRDCRSPVEMATCLVDRNVAPDLVLPFLKKATVGGGDMGEAIFYRCLGTQNYRAIAVETALTVDGVADRLLVAVLQDAGELVHVVEKVCSNGEVPRTILRRLLVAEDVNVALAAAVGMYESRRREKGEFDALDESLLQDWKRAILRSANSENRLTENADYWLGKILKKDGSLSRDWLVGLVSMEDGFVLRVHREIASKAVSSLTREQRSELLRCVKPKSGVGELIRYIVGGDVEVYRQLLGIESLSKYHMDPLGGHPVGEWVQLASEALDSGCTPDALVEAALSGLRETWYGSESEMWGGWVADFELLMQNSDSRLAKAGRLGAERARVRMQKCLEQERLESVRGIH